MSSLEGTETRVGTVSIFLHWFLFALSLFAFEISIVSTTLNFEISIVLTFEGQ